MSLARRPRAGVVIVVWALLLGLGAWFVANTRFTTDLSFFLPAKPTPAQQVLVEQLREGVVSRLLMVAIEGGDEAARGQASRALRERLAQGDTFVAVQNGELEAFDKELGVLLQHRYQLSPAVNAQRFEPEPLRQAIVDGIDLVSSPAGLLFKPYFTRDPTGEMLEVLTGWQSQGQIAMADGVWVSRDGARALLLLQTRAVGTDTDGQASAIEHVQHAFAAVAREHAGLHLTISGPGLFAVQARAAIQADVARLTLFSAIGINLLLFAMYRRVRLLLFTTVPVISGSVAGLVAVGLAHDSIFAITAGFGAALIGEAVDYGIYYFVQSGRAAREAWQQRYWPTIRLGVATSVCGFGALLFAGFPGLAQLGLYALTGVITAAAVTRLVLPAMAGDLTVRTPQLPAFVVPLVQRLRTLRWPVLALGVLALAHLVENRQVLWEPNLSALSSVSAEEAQRDTLLRRDLGAPDARYIVVVRAPSREAALQGAEAAGQRLAPLVEQGLIGGFDSPARFLPSEALQRQRQQALPEPAALRASLSRATEDLPVSAARLEPFVKDVAAARTAPPLTAKDLDGTALALAVDSLLQPHGDAWTALLPLRPAAASEGSDIPADAVRDALAGSGVLFLDLKTEFEAVYGDYLDEAIALSLAGMAAIALLMAVALRDARRLIAVLLPIAVTVVIVIAALHALGVRLHLLHLVGVLLIVAVGSNYALFLERWQRDENGDPQSLLSIGVACATTVIGFGALASSSVPVLSAVGQTVAPGALLALLLSAVLAPRVASAAGEPRA
jgi:predicted exporter